MKIPWGFKNFSARWIVVFKKTLYGVKNAVKAFWRLLLGIMNKLGYEQNHADPCLYYKWDDKFWLIVWLSHIDDLIVCTEDTMENVKKKFTETVNCDDIGEMKEYIGTKIKID